MNTERIFSLSPAKLKRELRNEMVKLGYNENVLHNTPDFLYVEGDAPYMLIAHLDTVHKNLPSIICYSKDGNYMMSPQGIGGDDRCGVYIILTLLTKLPFKPYVLFTMDEEVGGLGAKAFIDYMMDHDIPDLKYIVEYDRKGNDDCVFYSCDNQEFVEFVEQFGFKESYGTFSDISIIAPELSVAAVNLSSGYYNPHTEYEYVSFDDMHEIIQKSLKMFGTDCGSFKYIKKTLSITSYSSVYDDDIDKLVSFVPAGLLWIRNTIKGTWYENEEEEIAVDEEGNLYRRSPYYDDYVKMYVSQYTLYPTEENFVPEYDAENATVVQVFCPNYSPSYDY